MESLWRLKLLLVNTAEGERVSPGGLGVRLNLTEHGEKSVREGCQGANSAHNGPPKSLMKEVQVAAHDGKGDRNTRDENGARLGRSSVPHSLAQGSAPGTRSGVNVAGDNNNREGVVGYSAEQPSALRENIQSRDFRSPSGYLGGDKRTSKPGLHKNRETKGSDVTGCLRSGILTSRKYEPGALAHYLDSRKKKAEIHSKDVVKAKDTREGGFIPPPGQGMQQGPPDRPCKTHMIGTGNASGMKIDIKTTGACDMPTIPLCSSQAPVPSIRSSSLKSAHPSMGDTKHTAQFSHIMKTINDGNLSAFLPKDTGACAGKREFEFFYRRYFTK